MIAGFLSSSAGSKDWKADGDVAITTEKEIHGIFVPRHETAAELDQMLLADGEIATASDADDIRLGDGITEGGSTIFSAKQFKKQTGFSFAENKSIDSFLYPNIAANMITGISTASVIGNICDYAVGNGIIATIFENFIFQGAFDGQKYIHAGFNTGCDRLTYFKGMFFNLSGNGSIIISKNGVDWETETINLTASSVIPVVVNERLLVVLDLSTNYIYTSTDGLTYTEAADLSAYTVSGIYALGQNVIVLTGDNTYIYSSNGTTWSDEVTVPKNISVYNNSMFTSSIGVYGNGIYALPDGRYSTNLETWTSKRNLPWSEDSISSYTTLAFYDGLFVVIDQDYTEKNSYRLHLSRYGNLD